jgi:putative membrane protein
MVRPILIICIDRDNDLFEKARVVGPIVGRENNLSAATSLALADPEDPDSNAIFYAIKVYDQFKKENQNVEVVTLTGDRSLGFVADRNISSQLEKLISDLNPSSGILISDGPSDEEILPIIKSRLKVDSTRIVFIKQAKELEKTYFVLLEKLKDPYYAKYFIGLPSLLLLVFSISSYLGWGWQPVGILIGLFMLLRFLGIDDMLVSLTKDFRVSFERTTWIGYLGSFAIFAVGFFVGIQSLNRSISSSLTLEKIAFLVIGNTVWIFFIGFSLILLSKSMDSILEKRKYALSNYLVYFLALCLVSVVLFTASLWVVNVSPPYVDFGLFLFVLTLSLVLGYGGMQTITWYKIEVLKELKLEGREVISQNGSYIGRILGFDAKKNKFFLQNIFDKKIPLPISSILTIDEKVIIKSSD